MPGQTKDLDPCCSLMMKILHRYLSTSSLFIYLFFGNILPKCCDFCEET